jgi:Ion transport protein
VIRAFRSFRAFRLVTRIAPLRDLIAAIGAVMPRIYAIMMLLLLVFYIFAVLFTELFGHLTLSENYFTSLEASLLTCMQFMTLSWSGITRELMLFVPWAWVPVVSFIAVTGSCRWRACAPVPIRVVACLLAC